MKKETNKPILIDPNSVHISKNVTFGENVIVYPNNFLDEGTVIEDNVILFCGCHISKSKICKGAHVHASVVDCSTVGERSIVLPFCTITAGTVVGENVKILSHSVLRKTVVEDNSRIGEFCLIDYANIGKFCHVDPRVTIKGQSDKPAQIADMEHKKQTCNNDNFL